ncbi:imidazole glycerol phosphate synthase subunit HisH [Rhodoferax sp. 4810]|uniref:Imidazole glycerol phosphate synthase subunit HisH n=1 Tax=Thiospirillum jenense TaxID=1653858 RepID=A0A839H9T9_9GAMM|nr:imidazole glycerol phosphate synthase subunit HisH [Thiospirillum jenense]MBB1073505.1 imidazole glycerol phosphate synthase subunit HisH [Rhodoferax jenense]MBB1125993.1 imidazole glycerol phosphate synthase subunit HisH [Thiospirillum jenense]
MTKHTKIAIIDYGMGNLKSVANAFANIGYAAFIARNPNDLCFASHVVLPGVGAFGDGMKNLCSCGWLDILEEEVIKKGKPFMGICLGMQLLATVGTEYGLHKGLNWIPGTVKKIESNEPQIRVPHVGWNDVRILKRDGLYQDLGDSQVFYFVHSYVFDVENKGHLISGLTCHGIEFVASLEKNNIYATQFHPEKSQKVGLKVLDNFIKSTL